MNYLNSTPQSVFIIRNNWDVLYTPIEKEVVKKNRPFSPLCLIVWSTLVWFKDVYF